MHKISFALAGIARVSHRGLTHNIDRALSGVWPQPLLLPVFRPQTRSAEVTVQCEQHLSQWTHWLLGSSKCSSGGLIFARLGALHFKVECRGQGSNRQCSAQWSASQYPWSRPPTDSLKIFGFPFCFSSTG